MDSFEAGSVWNTKGAKRERERHERETGAFVVEVDRGFGVIDDNANVRTPIIFLAAHGDFSTTVTALKSGAVDFVMKPID